MPTELRFTAIAEPRPSGGISLALPADADEVWGHKPRHDVTGTVGVHSMRGRLRHAETGWRLELGPSWCRDPRVGPGHAVDVVLVPEPPQLDTVAPDVRAALVESPAARTAFESLATFYRKGFVRSIEAARRLETRRARIEVMVETLLAGRREP